MMSDIFPFFWFDDQPVLSQRKVYRPVLPAISISDAEKIADEVIEGKWGNGQDRYYNLNRAGYNYFQIQSIVDRKIAERDANAI